MEAPLLHEKSPHNSSDAHTYSHRLSDDISESKHDIVENTSTRTQGTRKNSKLFILCLVVFIILRIASNILRKLVYDAFGSKYVCMCVCVCMLDVDIYVCVCTCVCVCVYVCVC